MAGAAGFEPAVPGLGGRCIIQAMLHARSREHALLKKSAPKMSTLRRAIRCHEAGEASGEHMASNMSDLPNPYGEDDLPGASSESALERRVRIRDSQRVFWTKIATIRWSGLARISISFAAVLATLVLASGRGGELVNVGVALFALQAVLFFPAMLASSFAQMSARDRLQLKIGRTRSMEAYPGVERILNTLQERTLRERTRLICALLAAGALNSEDNFETGTILASILFGLSVFLGSISIINTLQLERRIPMIDSDFPLLSMHAPTLHQSTL